MAKKKSKILLKGMLVVALMITAIPAIAISTMVDASAVGKEANYTQYVDPFVSTEVDYGQLFPGSVVPNGLVKLSPDTYPHATLDHAGYDYKKTQIQGFSHTRIEGVGGQGAGGDVLVTPTYVQYTGRPKAETRAMTYDKKTEEAKPGYYKAELTPKTGKDNAVQDNTTMGKIKAEMTSDERTGFHRYTFPKAGNVNIIADLNYTYDGTDVRDAILDVVEENDQTTALGGRVSGRNVGGSGKYTLYFYIETSKPANNVKTWNGSNLGTRVSQKGNDLGAILNFDVKDNEEIQLKVSISPISVEQAKIDMKNEISDWDFENAYQRADKAWNDVLSKIRIETSEKSDPTGELKKLFYTHLYHMFMTPVNATSTTGIYRGTDGNIHDAKDYTHYDSWTLWDDYRKYPMIGLVMPDVYKDMVRSIADALDHGIVTWSHDKQPVPNVRTEHAVALLADGVAKGFTDIDNLEAAYEEAKKIANKVVKDDVNYVPGRVDQTVEYAYDDWALSLIADALGKQDEADYFLKRSFNYKNLYRKDAVDSPFSDKKMGLLWTKDANGNWREGDPIKIGEHGLYQGSMWQYSWYGSNDVNGMMDLMGGKEEMLEALQYLFGEQDPNNGKAMLHNAANEVELHAPYLFNFAGRPDKTQYWVRQIYTKETWNTGYASGAVKEKMYKLSPKGYLETMDDDAGTMAMMFVSAAMGIFPMTPGDTTFQIGSPFFEKVSLDVGNNKTFTIQANNVSPDNMYIQSASLNGTSFDRTWIDYSEITRGGTLKLEMGDTPSTWAQNGIPAKSSSDNADTSTYDNDEIAYSSGTFKESNLNDGSIDEKIIITLKTKEFNGEVNENLAATGKIKIKNVPDGMIASATKRTENTVEVTLKGKAKQHLLNDSIGNLSIELADNATKEKITDSIRKVKDNIKVMFDDNKLTYSSTQFKESTNDNGAITTATTISLTGDTTFSGKVNEDYAETGKVKLNNVPEGLKAKVIKTGDRTVVLSFEGKAKEHDYDVDFEVSFLDSAFNNATASQVENSSSGGMTALLLDFYYDKTTDLKKSIAKAKLIQDKVYTTSSYQELQTQIINAENLLKQKTIDNEDISKNMINLSSALNSLKLPSDGLKRLEGEKSDHWSGGELKNEPTNLGGTYDGAWIQYAGLDFNEINADVINIRYAASSSRCAADARIEVRQGAVDGELLGTAHLPVTSSWGDLKTVSIQLDKQPIGVQDIYFVLKGTTSASNPFIANIDYLQFSDGLPQIDKIKLEAEASHQWSGGTLKNEPINLGGTYAGAWVSYNNVDFKQANVNSIDIRYSTRVDMCATDARIEVRLGDKEGQLLSTVNMPLTTGWSDYQVVTANLSQTLNGTQNICFVLKGTTDTTRKYIANIDYMEFKNVPIQTHIEAENRNEWSGGELKTEPSKDSSGTELVNVGGTRDGSYLRYNGVTFDASGQTEMTVRYSHNPGSAGQNSRADIYLDDMNGTPVGTVQFPTTNGWANYTLSKVVFDQPISGKHDVYLKLRTDTAGKWVVNLDWLEFAKKVDNDEADKTELTKVYDKNINILKSSSKYDSIGFNHFKNAMIQAQDIIDNKEATDYQVKVSLKDIRNAIPALQYKLLYDISDMTIDMEMIEAKGYTKDSYDKLISAIANAKALGAQNTFEKYKEAYELLVNAHATLTILNKDALTQIIQRADAIDLSQYISKGQDRFVKALTVAKELVDKDSLTQKEVDDAVNELETAMSALQAKAVKTELKNKILEAGNLKANDYTKSSYDNLMKVLEQAKIVDANESATQEEVNTMVQQLQQAINELVKNVPSISGNPDNKPNDNNTGVETSDQTTFLLYGLLLTISIVGCIGLRRKKLED
ncbi:MAG: GH92 family glycosyl hydrolase [Coprobacillus sp.]